jgi:hypothetical protein
MATYNDLSELPARHRERMAELLNSGEEFVMAATYGWWILKQYSPFVVLTTERLLELQSISSLDYTDEIALATITRVTAGDKHDKGRPVLEVEGHGVREEFTLPSGTGKQFADAVRAQLDKQRTAV